MSNNRSASIRSQLLIQCLIFVSVVAGLTPMVLHGLPSWVRFFLLGSPTTVMLVIVAFCPSDESLRYNWGIFVALVFSQFGGYLLEMGSFVAGVLGFLAANIAYLTAFTANVRFAKRIAPFSIFGLLGVMVLAMTWKSIPGSHVLPVVLYCATIVSVPSQATTRYLAMPQIGTLSAALGTPLLLISDAMIAYDRFVSNAFWHAWFIMVTYFVGQWLITNSVIRWTQRKSEASAR